VAPENPEISHLPECAELALFLVGRIAENNIGKVHGDFFPAGALGVCLPGSLDSRSLPQCLFHVGKAFFQVCLKAVKSGYPEAHGAVKGAQVVIEPYGVGMTGQGIQQYLLSIFQFTLA